MRRRRAPRRHARLLRAGVSAFAAAPSEASRNVDLTRRLVGGAVSSLDDLIGAERPDKDFVLLGLVEPELTHRNRSPNALVWVMGDPASRP